MTDREIASIFEDIELKLIASLKRNLTGHKKWEEDLEFDWPAWQALKVKSLERFRKENKDIFGEYRNVIDKETGKMLTEQFSEGEALTAEYLLKNKEDNKPFVSDNNFFEIYDEKIESLFEEVKGKERTVENSALRMMDDVYRQTMLKTETAVMTGSMTIPQAIKLAVEDFSRKGINCIEYKNGRRVNIADYVHMVLRTSNKKAQLMGGAKQRAYLGIDTVRVSSYGSCSETCLPWQGLIFIDDVYGVFEGETQGDKGKSKSGKWYTLLSVAVKAGLFHPNCRHTLTTYSEGSRPSPQMDGKKIRQNYIFEQRQRSKERDIRKLKRMQEGTNDVILKNAYGKKVREAQADLRSFIAENKDVLRRDPWREQTYSSRSKGVLTTNRKYDKIQTERGEALNVEIDKFTPCLEDAKTGEILSTSYSLTDKSDIESLNNWNFDWSHEDLSKSEIYKLTLVGDNEIQGLVAITKFERDRAVYVNIAESAPHNLGKSKKYNGVGGHLFAIAAQRSTDLGYGGFVFMDAKNEELVDHYHKTLGATLLGRPHQFRMFIDEDSAQNLLSIYEIKEEK